MKKFYALLTVLCMALMAQAQVNVDNFESGDKGWVNVSCGGGIVENEYKAGINLSDHVLSAVRAPQCDNWSGVMINNYVRSGYRYLHAYMYRNNANVPNLKVSDTNPLDLAPMTTIVANQWQDVVWDLYDYISSGTEFIFFMVDRTNISEDAWMLIDEIQLSNDATPRTAVIGGATPEPDDYQLVWNEDFTDAALDRQVWNVETNEDGGGNNELQHYGEEGVSLGVEPTTGKKCLILTAEAVHTGNRDCYSGRVNTKNKMTYTFGKIEARIKFPNTANGLWPAFWQMGNNYDQVGWPRCGETDIIELGHQNAFSAGTQDRYFNGAMHVGARWDQVWSEANSVTWPYSVEDTFHIVSMIWTPTSIAMYMDDVAEPYFQQTLEPNDDPNYNRQEVFGKPNFLIANLAVGGNFPGIYSVNQITALANGPRSMYIDWIRIYQRGDANESFSCPTPSDEIEPTPENWQGTGLVNDAQIERNGQKVLRDGQLLIRRGNHLYTITGQIIQ